MGFLHIIEQFVLTMELDNCIIVWKLVTCTDILNASIQVSTGMLQHAGPQLKSHNSSIH